jgi:YhcH/YjgK/YiaL family protein
MILDKIENYKLYVNLSERIGKAFTYIKQTDFSKLEPGKYVIDNENIFALIQEYDTKEKTECKLESHFKYIDLQYMINGSERMGIASLSNQTIISKNEADDYAFYEGDCSVIIVETGMFTIFFPDDLHMPCLKLNQISKVKKVVIKIRI